MNERSDRHKPLLARSWEGFLVNVKPTLEKKPQSRYYELYFKNYKVPYAP